MTQNPTSFTASLYLNYWNKNCHPIIRPFIQEHLPYLLEDNTGYTAYAGEDPFAEKEYLAELKTIQFAQHPFFESNYRYAEFQCLLKLLDGKCVGHYTAQLCFVYESLASLNIGIADLKKNYQALESDIQIIEKSGLVSLHSKDQSNCTSSLYCRIKKDNKAAIYSLTVSGVSELI